MAELVTEITVEGIEVEGTHADVGVPDIDFLTDMREKFQRSLDADTNDRVEAKADLIFGALGEQWDDDQIKLRDEEGRPRFTFNKLPELVSQITGSQRKGSMAIKTRPVDDKGDPETSQTLNGLLMNIAHNSDAETAYDKAFESAVWCGRGFFRILTDYAEDDAFEQDIIIAPIKERFSVYFDPGAKEYVLSDGRWCFISEMMQRADFEKDYPGFSARDWEGGEGDWYSDDEVRVVEFFWVKETPETLYLLEDGTTTTTPEEGASIVRSRPTKRREIRWIKASGADILEGVVDGEIGQLVPGKHIPIVPVWGEEIVIDNVRRTRGAIRFARDPQKAYNYFRTTSIEVTATQPRAPYKVTAAMVKGYENVWKSALKKTLPFLPFNPDPSVPGGMPVRENPPAMSSGLNNEAIMADSEIKSTVGIHNPTLGRAEGGTSGRAIGLLQEKGDTGTFSYQDNLKRSLKYAGKIVVGMIPYIYDTERIIRIMNPDGSSSQVPINQPSGEENVANDLTTGKYDVVVDTGPDYKTQRAETTDFLMTLIQQAPGVAQYIMDIILRNSNVKDADEIETRLRKVLPPGTVEPREGEELPKPAPNPLLEFEQKKVVVELAQEEEELKLAQSKVRKSELEEEEQRLKNVELMKRNPEIMTPRREVA